MNGESLPGKIMFVLHAHLPYVRHPEHERHLEERWLFEAITETYIPLLSMMDRLEREGVRFRLTVSLSPTLLQMFEDEFLRLRYLRYLDLLLDLAHREIERTYSEAREFHHLAHMYNERLNECRRVFADVYGTFLARGFRRFLESGSLEIITSAATHMFLPLGLPTPSAIRRQLKVACAYHERVLGRRPEGMWLPECGYFPGLENRLEDEGIRYFFVDTHGIENGTPPPVYGVHAPVYCENGVAAFGRDKESSKSVWSAAEGYPGDGIYRDFYRDIGFDLPLDYVSPFIHEGGTRIHTGFKYHRITGKTQDKEPYDPGRGLGKAREHASDFYSKRCDQVRELGSAMDRAPLVVAPYDAELFGHWWFEGPVFLEEVLRLFAGSPVLEAATAPEYLDLYPTNQVLTPSHSSWGSEGYSGFWLSGANEWIYPHFIELAHRMDELEREFGGEKDAFIRRALVQAKRELLLLQASDWAFIMQTGTVVDYAVSRTKAHIANFNHIYEGLSTGTLAEEFLADCEWKNNPFPSEILE